MYLPSATVPIGAPPAEVELRSAELFWDSSRVLRTMYVLSSLSTLILMGLVVGGGVGAFDV